MISTVSDTGPILHLSEINKLSLLNIFSTIFTPNLVHKELKNYGISTTKLRTQGIHPVKVVNTNAEEINRLFERFKDYRIDSTDLSTIVAAQEKQITTILTDDLELRKAIEAYGLRPVGTIGVIVKAYKRGIIDNKKELEQLIDMLFNQSSLYISPVFKDFVFDMIKKLD